MKITGIETFCLRYRMPYALTYPRGEYQEREAVLVKVHTDDPNIYGWGEAAMWGGPFSTTTTVLEKQLQPLIVGQDPCCPEFLWEKIYQETYYHGRKGILLSCLSGIDIALWDILGKVAGQPLWRLLGGFARPIKAYASSGYYRRDYGLDALAADVGKAKSAGYRGYKMKVGNLGAAVHSRVLHETPLRVSFQEDIARVEAARQALGPNLDLMCDATTSLDAKTAMAYADEFERIGVRWFEEPTQPENISGCAELARRTRIPIAGFETETNKFNFAALMDAGAIQVVQPDVIQVGGITEARKIAAYAQMRHLTFSSKNYSTAVSLAACINLLYALPNADFFECDADPSPWREEFLKSPLFTFDDGIVQPFDRPGLGLDIDEVALSQWVVQP
ncbi:mandelate racemase/muconate lactonizing enzyme family protein [Dongia soli]|uniref:Mandelate racemase/muconate lactonizing enzyme family protein n=1 Tax=Dongia soli TaxID=600628 RepID=A0ABU5EBL8_9PROT|nr:mandelate racemase/muconate lactonizing enzyme family protein [Dongia soli]MDY0883583.1 mandelate racemase/muconate lactonizing enzyme family protein [Dongia soli]